MTVLIAVAIASKRIDHRDLLKKLFIMITSFG